MIRIGRDTFQQMCEQAAGAYPAECCGALLGVRAATSRDVLRAVPAGNGWPDHAGQGSRYLIPADALLGIEREAERDGLAVLGFYHSHPDGSLGPSSFDLEHALPWYSYLVLRVWKSGRGGATAFGWRLRDDRRGFHTEQLQIVNEERT